MPPGLRKTLYVRDDDWRFSLMMGNFVTLTNVDDAEFDRIIRRHASPLYVSVHATDPALRCRMMNNRFAGDILQRLTRLKDAGIDSTADCGVPRLERRRAAAQNVKRPSRPGARGADRGHGARGPHALS